MESALNPREIQSRIRAGATIDQVADESGVPAARIEPFATPVLAERQHQALNALRCPVRRRGETGSNRTLRTVVDERLLSMDIDSDAVEWDAWRTDDRLWLVVGRYEVPGVVRDAGDETDATTDGRREPQWRFDPRARYSVAVNDEARLLIGEATVADAPRPRGRLGTPVDHEPTVDLFDEHAMLRAAQDAAEMTLPLPTGVHVHGATPEPSPADYTELAARQGNGPHEVRPSAAPSEPRTPDTEPTTAQAVEVDVEAVEVRVVETGFPAAMAEDAQQSPASGSDDAEALGMPRPQYLRPERAEFDPGHPAMTGQADGTQPTTTPATDDTDAPTPAAGTDARHEDAGDEGGYVDTELEQVDGVYDFVPTSTTDLDSLYDMLQGFNEDSVNIYEGLDRLPPMVAQGVQEPPTGTPDAVRSGDEPADTPQTSEPAPVADAQVSDVELLGIEVTEQNLDIIEAAGTPDALARPDADQATTTPAVDSEAHTVAPGAAPAAQAPAPHAPVTIGDSDVVATGWPGTMDIEREPETGLENPVDHRANDAARAVRDDAPAQPEQPVAYSVGPADGHEAGPRPVLDEAPAVNETPVAKDASAPEPAAAKPVGTPAPTTEPPTPTGAAAPVASATPVPSMPATPPPATPATSPAAVDTNAAATEATPPASSPETEETTSIRPRSKRRKRAAVPSWDEIMFGGPSRG